jgi:hypothetical protein
MESTIEKQSEIQSADSKNTIMPSMNDLLAKYKLPGHHSIAYQNSRVILNNMDKPLVGYAVGWNCMALLLKSKSKKMYAYYRTDKQPYGHYHDPSFGEMPIEEALEIIRGNSEMVAESAIDESQLEDVYQVKVLGELEINTTDKWDSTRNVGYKVIELKSGMLSDQIREWRNKFVRCQLESLYDDYIHRNKVTKDDYVKKKVSKGTLSDELVARIKSQILVKQI